MPRVIDVEYLGGRALKVTFSNHKVRELDFTAMLDGILRSIDDDNVFGQVTVDPITKTLTWPTGVDLDPDVLSGDQMPANGPGPTVLAEYRLEASN